jgi:hypothetical protein
MVPHLELEDEMVLSGCSGESGIEWGVTGVPVRSVQMKRRITELGLQQLQTLGERRRIRTGKQECRNLLEQSCIGHLLGWFV